VDILHIPDLYRSIFPDFTIEIPKGRQNYEDALCSQFPRRPTASEKFSTHHVRVRQAGYEVMRVGMKAVMENPSEYPELVGQLRQDAVRGAQSLVSDEKARAVIGQLWGYFCQPPIQDGLPYLCSGPGQLHQVRSCPCQRDPRKTFTGFLSIPMESYGGEVWFNNGAKKNFSEGRQGARSAGPRTALRSLRSMSYAAANPVTTSLELIGRDNMPGWYPQPAGWMERLAPSTFNIYVGLRLPLPGCRGLPSMRISLIKRMTWMHSTKTCATRSITEPDGNAIVAYNVVDSTVSPRGTGIVRDNSNRLCRSMAEAVPIRLC